MQNYQILQAIFVVPWATFWYLLGTACGTAKFGFKKGMSDWGNDE